ncbi:mammalian cell entry protein, partial [Mycobacterium sp. ITM-2017-0098]
ATLTLDLEPSVELPVNTLAKIGQTSLLGSQHVQLDLPPDPSSGTPRRSATGSCRPTSASPTTERVLASIASILTGGGVSNL